ncbi:MAG: SDR family NAD(P)-dependent oxidoreductase [Chloroflexota bacterium]
MRLAEKVIIVTGGGKGLGRVYARGLAAEGAHVVIAEIDAEAGVKTAEEIRASDGDARAFATDVSRIESVQALVERTVDQLGRVDVLVNNAALFADLPNRPWQEITPDEWDQVMAVNLRGVFLCCQAVIPVMAANGGGSIINVSSSTIINGGRGSIHYTASKAGVMGVTRAFARQVGDLGVRVNTLAPGGTASDTLLAAHDAAFFDRNVPMRSIKRWEQPEDLLGTVIFLASDESAFLTGQMIVVDGGKDFH